MSNINEILEKINLVKKPHSEFDGSISPLEAWNLIQQYPIDIHLIDIRSNEERVFTGYVPNSEHFTWAAGTSFVRNPRFIKEVEHKLGKKNILFLLCRSGNRSTTASIALKSSGFDYVFNISEGFEGDLNEQQQRSQLNGWKFHKLPWVQS